MLALVCLSAGTGVFECWHWCVLVLALKHVSAFVLALNGVLVVCFGG